MTSVWRLCTKQKKMVHQNVTVLYISLSVTPRLTQNDTISSYDINSFFLWIRNVINELLIGRLFSLRSSESGCFLVTLFLKVWRCRYDDVTSSQWTLGQLKQKVGWLFRIYLLWFVKLKADININARLKSTYPDLTCPNHSKNDCMRPGCHSIRNYHHILFILYFERVFIFVTQTKYQYLDSHILKHRVTNEAVIIDEWDLDVRSDRFSTLLLSVVGSSCSCSHTLISLKCSLAWQNSETLLFPTMVLCFNLYHSRETNMYTHLIHKLCR